MNLFLASLNSSGFQLSPSFPANRHHPLESPFGRRHEMRWQLSGQVVAVQLDVHEVHGQRELVGVQHPVFVDVRQFPDLAEDVVGQLRLDHLLLGG